MKLLDSGKFLTVLLAAASLQLGNAACSSGQIPDSDYGAIGFLSAQEPIEAHDSDVTKLVAIPDGTPSEIIHYPGFVLSFNPMLHIPNWVAWELTEAEAAGSAVSRKQVKFQADRNVKGSAQYYDYKGSNWTRGHMCPAGDMKWAYEPMEACFKMTNICPQSAELNSGPWNDLETKCRQWATRDSALYIVCGPVLADDLDERIGTTGVAVPKRFFKVLLAPYADPPRAIGFVMDNTTQPARMRETALSVDEVEAITGIDFFAFLDDEVEDQIEAQCNYPQWNRRK